MIAHRLSTIRNADCIVVIDDEGIREQGTHQELLEQGGMYAGLYNVQYNSEFFVAETPAGEAHAGAKLLQRKPSRDNPNLAAQIAGEVF